MKIQKKLVFIYACALLVISGCYYRNEEDLYPGSSICDTNNVTYSASVAPVFATYCNSCHGGNTQNGGIQTDTISYVVANITRIRGAVNWDPKYLKMPKDGAKLPACDLNKIDIWIRQGMKDN